MIPELDHRARSVRGAKWYRETEDHYQLRYNHAFVARLVQLDWQTLAALNGLSDLELCHESCALVRADYRHLIESALAWKNSQDADRWNTKLYWVAFVTLLLSAVIAIAAVLSLEWYRKPTYTKEELEGSMAVLAKRIVYLTPTASSGSDWRMELKRRLHKRNMGPANGF